VLAGASNQYEKQRMFASWFQNSKLLAEVVYYDKEFENAARNSSASASCCAANNKTVHKSLKCKGTKYV